MTAIRSKMLARALWSLVEEDAKSPSDVAYQFVRFLETHHILHMAPTIMRHLERMHETHRSARTLYIRTAHPIGTNFVEAIRARMNVPGDADMRVEEDSSVVGGFVGTYGEHVYDASIGKQLALLRERLVL